MFMEWMHEKYLRNREFEKVEALYREERSRYACGRRSRPPQYPVRPTENHSFAPIGGFPHHPNESKEM